MRQTLYDIYCDYGRIFPFRVKDWVGTNYKVISSRPIDLSTQRWELVPEGSTNPVFYDESANSLSREWELATNIVTSQSTPALLTLEECYNLAGHRFPFKVEHSMMKGSEYEVQSVSRISAYVSKWEILDTVYQVKHTITEDYSSGPAGNEWIYLASNLNLGKAFNAGYLESKLEGHVQAFDSDSPKVPVGSKCVCDIMILMGGGCVCGSIVRQEDKEKKEKEKH